MKNSHFTIVIPTRRRIGTFKHALHTCLTQDYDNFEVVALVNSCPETAAYLSALDSPKVRNIESLTDLQMTENWERLFELELQQDTYILYLGDDDGLLPGALSCANRIISERDCRVLSWDKAEYAWPDVGAVAYRNYASLRLSSTIDEVKARPFLELAHAMDTSYSVGPSIYSSFVQLSILQEIRTSADNKFFRSCSPDVFSSYAIAASIESFTRCRFALSVNGASGNSNGIAYIHQFQSDASAQFRASRPTHPLLVHTPSACIAEADSLLTARDSLPDRFREYQFSFPKLIARLEQDAKEATEERRSLLRTAIGEISARNGLPVPSEPRKNEAGIHVSHPAPAFGYVTSSSCLTIDLGRIGIQNVAEACRAIAMLNPLETLPRDGNEAASTAATPPGKSILRRIVRKVASYL